MSAKKNPVGGNDKATAVGADDSEETLKRVGGSQSADWNHVLGNQAIQSLWIEHSDKEVRKRQYNAAIAGLIGIAPQDEIEGMIAAQLIATHNATIECHRRAMIGAITSAKRTSCPAPTRFYSMHSIAGRREINLHARNRQIRELLITNYE